MSIINIIKQNEIFFSEKSFHLKQKWWVNRFISETELFIWMILVLQKIVQSMQLRNYVKDSDASQRRLLPIEKNVEVK